MGGWCCRLEIEVQDKVFFLPFVPLWTTRPPRSHLLLKGHSITLLPLVLIYGPTLVSLRTINTHLHFPAPQEKKKTQQVAVPNHFLRRVSRVGILVLRRPAVLSECVEQRRRWAKAHWATPAPDRRMHDARTSAPSGTSHNQAWGSTCILYTL